MGSGMGVRCGEPNKHGGPSWMERDRSAGIVIADSGCGAVRPNPPRDITGILKTAAPDACGTNVRPADIGVAFMGCEDTDFVRISGSDIRVG
jgi:hypothetical protein